MYGDKVRVPPVRQREYSNPAAQGRTAVTTAQPVFNEPVQDAYGRYAAQVAPMNNGVPPTPAFHHNQVHQGGLNGQQAAAQMHGKRDEESGAAGGTPRVCGCARRTCLIITAAIVGAVLLAAIALGVGLGVGLKSSNGPGPSPSPVQSPSPVAQPVAPAATPVVPSPSSAATSEAPDPATQTGGTTLDCQPCSSDAECLSGTCGNTYDGSLGYSTCATSDSIPCMLVTASPTRGTVADCATCTVNSDCTSGLCTQQSADLSFCTSTTQAVRCVAGG